MKSKFYWGTIPRAIYVALLWFTAIVIWAYPGYLSYYILLLIFLGLGLRPLIEFLGLYDWFQDLLIKVDHIKWGKKNEQRRQDVDREERDKKYRRMRTKHPKLPKNW